MEAVHSEGDNRSGLYAIKHTMKKEQRKLLIRRFLSNKLALTGMTVTLLLVVLALLAPLLTEYDPFQMEVADRLQPPGPEHWLGTDNLGRDLLSRILFGARVSLGVGFSVAFIASVIGMTIGLIAAYYKVLDNVLMRICDGLMAFPGILLAISIMAALGAKTVNVIIALSIVFFPHIARVVRSSALVIREQTYIEAMRAMGARSWRIIWLHVAPNTLSPLIVQASFIFADAIIVEAGLSFLGAGVPAPEPSWGNILSEGKIVLIKAWWMTVFPAIAIILSVLGLNLSGDGLRDLLDPYTNQAKK